MTAVCLLRHTACPLVCLSVDLSVQLSVLSVKVLNVACGDHTDKPRTSLHLKIVNFVCKETVMSSVLLLAKVTVTSHTSRQPTMTEQSREHSLQLSRGAICPLGASALYPRGPLLAWFQWIVP